MREVEEQAQIVAARARRHEFAERLRRQLQSLDVADVPLAHRQQAGVPGLVEHRLHDEEGQEQREPDQHHVRRRALRAQGTAQQRQHDHDAGERGRHHQQAGRERQHRDQGSELHDARRGAGPARAEIERDRLRERQLRQQQHEQRDGDAHHGASPGARPARRVQPADDEVLRTAGEQHHLSRAAAREHEAAARVERDDLFQRQRSAARRANALRVEPEPGEHAGERGQGVPRRPDQREHERQRPQHEQRRRPAHAAGPAGDGVAERIEFGEQRGEARAQRATLLRRQIEAGGAGAADQRVEPLEIEGAPRLDERACEHEQMRRGIEQTDGTGFWRHVRRLRCRGFTKPFPPGSAHRQPPGRLYRSLTNTGQDRAAMMDFSHIPLFALADKRLAWIDRRQELLAENIANADTPGWRAHDLVPFVKTLQQAGVALARTDPAHLVGNDAAGDLRSEQEKTERAPDGNGVAIDQELKKVADTDSAHELVSLIDMKYLGLFRTVIGK